MEEISDYERKHVLEMCVKILNHLARRYTNVRKGVSAVMLSVYVKSETRKVFEEGEKGEKKE